MSLFTGAAAIAAAVAAAGGTAAAAKMSSNATTKGAKLQTDAANRAAELQKQASDETIAFERQKDAEDRARAEVDRRANYDQYVSRYRNAQNLGHAFGFDMGDAPAYVPGEPTSSAGAPAGTAPSGAGGGLPPVPKDLQTAIAQANQLAYGGANKHNDPNYWAGMWQKDPGYTWRRLLGEGAGGADVARGGPFAGAGGAPKGNTAASLLLPHTAAPMLAVGPKTNTIRDYLATRI